MVIYDAARVIDLDPDCGRSAGQDDRISHLAIVQAQSASAPVHQVELIGGIGGNHGHPYTALAADTVVGIGGRGNRKGEGDGDGNRNGNSGQSG